jgi:hypothetical protein
MNKYENGKIYKIEAINGEVGDIYIGSTTQKYLCSRMTKHRSDYKRKLTRSYKIFDKYGLDNCIITLLENVNCRSKDELIARERFYIETLQCVNKKIAVRTMKEYREMNREKLKESRKMNYNVEKNKQKYLVFKEKGSKNFKCECGAECWEMNKNRHFKSKRHQDFMNESK